jgi:hypothetical protein
MSTYAAYDAYDCRITSVFADSPKEALERLTDELQRPGRRNYYDAWKDGNFQVTVDDSVEKQELLETVSTSPVVIQDAIYREITIQNHDPEEKLGATDAWVLASRMVDPKEWEFYNTRRQLMNQSRITVIFKRIS